MNERPDHDVACERVRDELPAVLYGDLDDSLRVSVEAHLEQCSSCRAVMEGQRRTMRLLDDWPLAVRRSGHATGAPPAFHQRSRSWLRPLFVGAAAAAVAFATLSWLGASLERRNGQVVIALGHPSAPPHGTGRQVTLGQVEEAVDVRMTVLLEALGRDLTLMERSRDQTRMHLARAVDERRVADLRHLGLYLESLARRYDQEAARAARFQDDMMEWRRSVDVRLSQTLRETN